MMLRNLLIVSSIAAVAAILGSAVLALDEPGREPAGEPGSSLAAPLGPDTAERELLGNVDPAATGVIAVRDMRTGILGSITPGGERLRANQPSTQTSGFSFDNSWFAANDCTTTDGCRLVLGAADGSLDAESVVELEAPFMTGEWAPAAPIFAARDTANNLYTVRPEEAIAHRVATGVTAYAWANGVLLFATQDGSEGVSFAKLDADGAVTPLAGVDAPVLHLYPSPNKDRFAFAQDDPDGWKLMAIDVASGAIEDFGNLGASANIVVREAPAFSIAWSPDAAFIAIGPVTSHFPLIVLQPGAPDAVHRYALKTGYAGELRWSPDGDSLAISTYAPNRVWHEVYVLETDNLDTEPRYLLDGCEIVWSPESDFVAVKREPLYAHAIAVIRVDTGSFWHALNQGSIVPVAWGTDAEDAMMLAQRPILQFAQWGK